jgi:hypothetical protein
VREYIFWNRTDPTVPVIKQARWSFLPINDALLDRVSKGQVLSFIFSSVSVSLSLVERVVCTCRPRETSHSPPITHANRKVSPSSFANRLVRLNVRASPSDVNRRKVV